MIKQWRIIFETNYLTDDELWEAFHWLGENRETLLHYVVRMDEYSLAMRLMQMGASHHTMDSNGVTPLDISRKPNYGTSCMLEEFDEYVAMGIITLTPRLMGEFKQGWYNH